MTKLDELQAKLYRKQEQDKRLHAHWQRTLKELYELHFPFTMGVLLKTFPVVPLPKPDPSAICIVFGSHPLAGVRCPRHGKVCRGS